MSSSVGSREGNCEGSFPMVIKEIATHTHDWEAGKKL